MLHHQHFSHTSSGRMRPRLHPVPKYSITSASAPPEPRLAPADERGNTPPPGRMRPRLHPVPKYSIPSASAPPEPRLAPAEERGDALLVILAEACQRELVDVHVAGEIVQPGPHPGD